MEQALRCTARVTPNNDFVDIDKIVHRVSVLLKCDTYQHCMGGLRGAC